MDTFFHGIAPEHAAALIAGVVALVTVLLLTKTDPVEKWAAALLAYASGVHLMLPFGHAGMTAPYLLSALAFGALSVAALKGRHWRLGTAILAPATVVAYLVWGGNPDQVGILTVLIELTAFGLALSHRQILCGVATVTAVLLAGAAMWIASFRMHQANHEHHEHFARAQAGVIMRPLGENHHASHAQTAAALQLVQATAATGTKYARLSEALAAGYRYPLGNRVGLDVHLEQPEYKKDGRQLDPDRPEMLVYAIADGKATLLGAVYVMERAGEPGPAPGGPITRWHAHNLCVSLAPPGIGIVTPYGGCPPLSLTITIAEMMHVWIVDPPGGPFAEGVPKEWTAIYHHEHGLAM